MTEETKHLLKWWREWLNRFFLTSYHLINRKAYRKWKAERKNKRQGFYSFEFIDRIDSEMNEDLFH